MDSIAQLLENTHTRPVSTKVIQECLTVNVGNNGESSTDAGL